MHLTLITNFYFVIKDFSDKPEHPQPAFAWRSQLYLEITEKLHKLNLVENLMEIPKAAFAKADEAKLKSLDLIAEITFRTFVNMMDELITFYVLHREEL